MLSCVRLMNIQLDSQIEQTYIRIVILRLRRIKIQILAIEDEDEEKVEEAAKMAKKIHKSRFK